MEGEGGPEDKAAHAAYLEQGRWLFAQACDFLLGVVSMKQLPPMDLPEVAFAGRSNVGKSSLVNALTGRKTLARTSNTPGRTKELNYFRLGPHTESGEGPALYLVDLPGYGYARETKTRVEAWTDLVMSYLQGRANLHRVILLIDSRHGVKPNDREVMSLLDKAAVSYLAVLTKTDKLKPSELKKVVEATAAELKKHPAAHPEVIATSSVTKDGIAELRAHITALVPDLDMGSALAER
ncbi:ribosome biogenesis GTP-binding protein YihA/YsxC [Tepidicaulis sp.]|uniref:ribosome biogenesis GTP-binding protein YihA/YsxC n=1 Tax=Tepidicaulis sp. TaxID=1920809 RepID=UPI003B5AF258